MGSFPRTLALILTLAAFIFWQVEANLKPTLMTIAETKAKAVATETINNIITKEISAMIDPKTLVSINLDDRGRVVFIQPNTLELNRLSANAAVKIQNALKEMGAQKIFIPLGQISGSQIFAAAGPRIPITIIPMGTVEVKVVDTFEHAGINQTRHMIYLAVLARVRIIIPLVSKSVEINSQIPAAEYIIVGEVPNTYLQLPFSANPAPAQ
ncbi:MAG: sporulation protein YunB [Sporomusaceae bacterium]|nr:sporulation protein YunB [Sporomusaceae bacterium]